MRDIVLLNSIAPGFQIELGDCRLEREVLLAPLGSPWYTYLAHCVSKLEFVLGGQLSCDCGCETYIDEAKIIVHVKPRFAENWMKDFDKEKDTMLYRKAVDHWAEQFAFEDCSYYSVCVGKN